MGLDHLSGTVLTVQTYTEFTDSSGRSNYVITDTFTRGWPTGPAKDRTAQIRPARLRSRAGRPADPAEPARPHARASHS